MTTNEITTIQGGSFRSTSRTVIRCAVPHVEVEAFFVEPASDFSQSRERDEREPVSAHREQFALACDVCSGVNLTDEGGGRFLLQQGEVEGEIGDEERMRLFEHDGVHFVVSAVARQSRNGNIEDTDDWRIEIDTPVNAGPTCAETDKRTVVHRLQVERIGCIGPCRLGGEVS